MRYFASLIFWLLATAAVSQTWEDKQVFQSKVSSHTLRVISSTDTAYLAPVLNSFLEMHPSVRIEYMIAGSSDIDQIFRSDPSAFDVVISSAMDLQFKLVNDGFAQPIEVRDHPKDAKWRDSLFAFTSEPAAIVLNRRAFDGYPLPRSRQDLINALRQRPEMFRNRIGTYDVRLSGLGYLFATQDAHMSETFWRLTEVMGALESALYCCSGTMIDDVASGRLAVAYNVLGSYAQARTDLRDQIEVVVPQDFATTMMRTAFVSSQAPQPSDAAAFVTHLVTASQIPTLPPLTDASASSSRLRIALEPALLTYLDQLKRRSFLEAWENAILQPPRRE